MHTATQAARPAPPPRSRRSRACLLLGRPTLLYTPVRLPRRPHTLGVDDGPFQKRATNPVPIVGVMMEGSDLAIACRDPSQVGRARAAAPGAPDRRRTRVRRVAWTRLKGRVAKPRV